MDSDNIHTPEEIDTAAEELLAWARAHGGVLVVAAAFGEDRDDPVQAGRAEAMVAGALGGVGEVELALLLAQLDVAMLMTLSQMAEGAEMGEEAFRRMFNTFRREMLDAVGLDLCDECGG